MIAIRSTLVAAVLGAALLQTAPAFALGLKDCSDKYSAAKTAGTLGTKTWAEFRKSDCGANAKPVAAPAAPAAAAAPAPAPAAAPPKPAAAAPAATAPAAVGSAVFPSAISAAHKSERASKGRFNTCLDQYRANKATNSNGGLKWIQKGGGYFSQCTKRLKG